MTELRFTAMPFAEGRRQAWVRGDYGLLTKSHASAYLQRVLVKKAKKRRKRRESDRFFGEAYVAATVTHKFGYYASFRWLTGSHYLSSPPEANDAHTDRAELHRALWDHFGEDRLNALRETARRAGKEIGEKPGPPDLWLIDKAGNHRFIEVKLPGDTIRPCQLAGLAVIAAALRSRAGAEVAVEIIDLHPDALAPDKMKTFNRLLKQASKY